MPTERLSLDAAAARLGVSVHTIRRRIRAGTLPTEQEPVRGGFRYVIILDSQPDQADACPPEPALITPTSELLTQVSRCILID